MRVLLGRLVGAGAAGALLAASFPPVDLWWVAFPALAGLVLCLAPWGGDRTPRARTGALVGLVAGFAFFMLLVSWVGLYVGAYAAWGLSLVEALYLAAFGAGAVPIVREALRPGRRGAARAVGGVVALAGWWSLWEWIRSSWPWGGFPWGRLAFGQADGPVLGLAALGGTALMGAAVMAVSAALALAVLLGVRRRSRPAPAGRRGAVTSGAVTTGAVTTGAALVAVPLVVAAGSALSSTAIVRGPGETGEAGLRVAVVQGNVPRLGLDFASQRRAVLDNHVRETLRLADDVAAGRAPRPDLVVWPENASDVPALRDRRAAASLSAASERVGAPILVGTIDRIGAGPQALNSYLVWDGDRGAIGRHDKHYVQPFGEWLPMRAPLEKLFPIARTAGNFVPGDDPGLVHAAGTDLAVATCFEVAFDAAVREPVSRGARVLLVPTNNATFGRSPMTYQQLAMSRVRAVEHDIPVVVSATSGVSAVIAPDGRVEQHTEIFEPAVLGATLPRTAAGTLATRMGGAVEAVLCAIGVAGLAWATALAGARRHRTHPTADEDSRATEETE